MNTKFTVIANSNSGKSLTLKLLSYFILKSYGQSVSNAYRFYLHNKKWRNKHYDHPCINDYHLLCPTCDVRVVIVLSDVVLVICSASDTDTEVAKNWDIYEEAKKIANGKKIIFVSSCHYKDNAKSFDKEIELRNMAGFQINPIYDFVMSTPKYNPYMDVCAFSDHVVDAMYNATYPQISDEEVDRIIKDIESLSPDIFAKRSGDPGMETKKNAVRRALSLWHEIQKFI